VNNAAPDTPMSKEEAHRLLEQTTFGARIKDIEYISGKGPEHWINEQMALPATFMSDGLIQAKNDRWNEYINVWWRHAVHADDQLRQRVAFALSEIFVISSNDGLGDEQPALANYYDMLLRHSFGNYRDLIEEITLNPVMGEYLSMKGNHKPDPEENLRPDENYAQKLLNDFVVPAGQSAEQDLADALDNIANHQNVGPFIVKQLIAKLVTSNPSPTYVRDVVQVFNKNAEGERGNLGSTIKAMLMHSEARQGHLNSPDSFGKTKEPLLRISQIWRAFEPADGIHPDFNYAWVSDELQQAPLASPSVFNFFTPDFSQPGNIRDSGLVSPEFEILDESSMISLTSRILANTLWSHNFKVASDDHRIAINIDREMNMEHDREALLDHLDLLLLGGRMSADLRQEVSRLMDSRDYDNAASQRIAEAIFLIMSSPEAAIQI